MNGNGNQQLPVRHVKREAIAPAPAKIPQPDLTGYDKVSLEEIRQFVADIRRRMNSLDAMLKRAQEVTTE